MCKSCPFASVLPSYVLMSNPTLIFFTRVNTPVIRSDFLSEFTSVLAANGVSHLFGLKIMAVDSGVEVAIEGKEDRGGILPITSFTNPEKYIAVAFSFERETPGFKVLGRCGRVNTESPGAAKATARFQ